MLNMVALTLCLAALLPSVGSGAEVAFKEPKYGADPSLAGVASPISKVYEDQVADVYSGLSSEESKVAGSLLKLENSDESVLVKIVGSNNVPYYLTENIFYFHGNKTVTYRVYRYENQKTVFLFARNYEQEGSNGSCLAKRMRKGHFLTGGQPAAFVGMRVSQATYRDALLQARFVNCETKEESSERIDMGLTNFNDLLVQVR